MKIEKGTNTPDFWNVPCPQCGARVSQPCLKIHSSVRARDAHTERIRATMQRLQAQIPDVPSCEAKSEYGAGLICDLEQGHPALHHDLCDAVWWQTEDEHDQVG